MNRAINSTITLIVVLLIATPGFPFDSSLSVIPVEGDIQKIFNETETVYKITSANEYFMLPDTPFQKIITEKTKDRSKEIIIRALNRGVLSKPSDNFMANTRFLRTDHPRIIKIAAKLKASGNPVEEIEKWVNVYIHKKSFGIPLIPAPEILEDKRGDCTEHAILAVSLLRASGIPARAVVGMVFCKQFDNYQNVFVFHMWAEAFYKGKWVLVDAAKPQTKNPNRYIAFAYHHLKTEMPLAYLKAVSTIKDLRVRRLESQPP